MSQAELLSDDVNVMARGLFDSIAEYEISEKHAAAEDGVKYYQGKHDILDRRIFYLNDDDQLVEDTYASNIKIAHQFFTEQIDQKVQYLLSNPVQFEAADENFQKFLDSYIDAEFQLSLQESCEGMSKKGYEYVFARTFTDDQGNEKIQPQVADSLKVFPVFDYDTGRVVKICRWYIKDEVFDGKTYQITHAELWDDSKVYYFKTSWNNPQFQFDRDREFNPRPHILGVQKSDEEAEDAEQQKFSRTYGQIPFYRLQNNLDEISDLAPIRSLIDDYDLMNVALSNNLQDFAEAIYAVKGFQGESLDKLRKNLKTKKTIGLDDDGGLDVKTVNIPVEARQAKLDLDKENIYKFGKSFDSTQVGDGNVTNIVIKARYTLLNMKANQAEVRLRAMLQWLLKLIVADINRQNGTAYDAADIEITFTREVIANDTDTAAVEKTKADMDQVKVQTILAAAPKLDSESVLKLLCDVFDLEIGEVKDGLDDEQTEDISSGTDPTGLTNHQAPVQGEPSAAGQNLPPSVSNPSEPAAVKGAGQKMYGTQSVLKNFKKGDLTRATAKQMLKLLGWSDEEAENLLNGGDESDTSSDSAAPASVS